MAGSSASGEVGTAGSPAAPSFSRLCRAGVSARVRRCSPVVAASIVDRFIETLGSHAEAACSTRRRTENALAPLARAARSPGREQLRARGAAEPAGRDRAGLVVQALGRTSQRYRGRCGRSRRRGWPSARRVRGLVFSARQRRPIGGGLASPQPDLASVADVRWCGRQDLASTPLTGATATGMPARGCQIARRETRTRPSFCRSSGGVCRVRSEEESTGGRRRRAVGRVGAARGVEDIHEPGGAAKHTATFRPSGLMADRTVPAGEVDRRADGPGCYGVPTGAGLIEAVGASSRPSALVVGRD